MKNFQRQEFIRQQAEAYYFYAQKGGGMSFDAWARSKDFAPWIKKAIYDCVCNSLIKTKNINHKFHGGNHG